MAYYSPYFTDSLKAVVKDNQQIDNLFQNYQEQLNSLKASINRYEDQATRDYNSSLAWANAGNQQEDYKYYSLYRQDYNNATDAIKQYNALVDKYNTLVTTYTGGQPISQLPSSSRHSAQ